MKNTVSAAVALPTALVIALGGLLMTTPPARAEVAPVAAADQAPAEAPGGTHAEAPEEAGQPAADEADAGQPSAGEVEAEQPVDTVPGPVPVPAPDSAPSVAPDAAQAPVVQATSLRIVSPAADSVQRQLGFELVFETDLVRGEVEIVASGVEGVRRAYGVSGPVVRETFVLGSDAASRQVVTVVLRDEEEREVARQSVQFSVDVPQSPVPTLSAPLAGERVVGLPGPSGNGAVVFDLSGTGVPGSQVLVRFDALDGQEGWGSDDQPGLVRPDGTWSWRTALPSGDWGIRLRQVRYSSPVSTPPGEEGPVRARESDETSSTFSLVDPAAASVPDPAPVVPADVAAPALVSAPALDGPRALASTGSDATVPLAGLAGAALVLLGAAAAVAGRVRSRLRAA